MKRLFSILFFILPFFTDAQQVITLPINGGGVGIKINANRPGTVYINFQEAPPIVTEDTVAYFYIMAGQSNCGTARTSEMSGPEAALYDKDWANPKIYNRYMEMTAFDSLKTGTNTASDPNPNSQFGAESYFFKKMLDTFPNRKMYLLKYGHSGSTLCGTWRYNASGLNFDKLMLATADALDEMIADGKTPVLKAFIWIQGEGDAVDLGCANAYGNNLTNFFNTFKTEYNAMLTARGLSTVTNINKLITDNYAAGWSSAVYRDTIHSAKVIYCANPANTAEFIPTQDLPLRSGDVVHWSATGTLTLGDRLWQYLKTY